MRNTLVSIALTCLLGLLFLKIGHVVVNAYTASSIQENARIKYKREDFNKLAKYYSELTPVQRDSVLQVWKLSKGLK